MKAFHDLLLIKNFRETRAELAVVKQRHALAIANERRHTDDEALRAFRHFALVQERGWYADLCRRIVRVRDIEAVQQSVVILRSDERTREDALAQSEQALNAEKKRMDEARENHRLATLTKQKFVELVRVHSDDELKELERQEDAEMEEIAELRRDRADWNCSDDEIYETAREEGSEVAA